ncbi:hypothetical protein D3C76_25410 [compost metagenome]
MSSPSRHSSFPQGGPHARGSSDPLHYFVAPGELVVITRVVLPFCHQPPRYLAALMVNDSVVERMLRVAAEKVASLIRLTGK